jgi:hypothetical protein
MDETAQRMGLVVGSDLGLTYIEGLARHGATQAFIAAKLEIPAKQFKKLLADDADQSGRSTRLAWERGHAEHEQESGQLPLEAGRNDDAIERELLRSKHVMRYVSKDDFGLPESAFLICRFWLIDAW